MNFVHRGASAALAAMLLAACVSVPTPAARLASADALAASRGWQARAVDTGMFRLITWAPTSFAADDALAIYIEGDGLAWIASDLPSADPTPVSPLALQLALAQPAGNAAYVARPCQYVDAAQTGCASRWWTAQRFAPDVIEAVDRAVDALKVQAGARRLTLVGYSGGGAVAALVAARRSDVERLVTVAGNLDHGAWTRHHRLPPLDGSLDAADVRDALRRVRQWHFAGGRDTVVPAFIAEGFAAGFPVDTRPVVRRVADNDHRCCWAEQWPRLWSEVHGTKE